MTDKKKDNIPLPVFSLLKMDMVTIKMLYELHRYQYYTWRALSGSSVPINDPIFDEIAKRIFKRIDKIILMVDGLKDIKDIRTFENTKGRIIENFESVGEPREEFEELMEYAFERFLNEMHKQKD